MLVFLMDLPSVFAEIIELFISGDWASVAVAICFLCIAQARRIVDSFDYLRDRKIRSISGFLDLEAISDDTKYVLKETIDQITFLRATGVSTDEKGRKKIAGVLKDSEGNITVLGLRRIRSYIRHEDGEVRVLIKKIDKFEAIWNFVTFVLLLFLLGSLVLTLIKAEELNNATVLTSGLVFIFGFVVMIFPIRTMNAFNHALDARDAFTKYEANTSEVGTN